MKRPSAQLSLLDLAPAAQKRRGGVSAALYDGIVALRYHGIPVYAAGALHKVGGRLLTTAELRRFLRDRWGGKA